MRTVGRVTREDGYWVIDCEPHVMLRAKRVFAQLSANAVGSLRLYDTPSVSRDLEWFLERYPMTVSDPDLLARRARAHDRAMSCVQHVLEGSATPPEFELAIPARRYQRTAAQLVLETGRLLLADDVGLGKTATAICVLSDPRTRPAVVVTLTHLPQQWRAEIQRFAPKAVVHIPKHGTPRPRELAMLKKPATLVGPGGPDVIVLPYSKLSGWADTIAQIVQPKAVVFDEIQELRTGTGTAKGAAAALIARGCAYRMGLSATPIYNYGGEFWNIVEPLEHGALGTRTEFEQEWCSRRDPRDPNKSTIKDPKALGVFLRERGLMLRRVGADVKDEVPELAHPIRIPHLVDHDRRALDAIQSNAAELARIILDTTAKPLERMQASSELDWRMRQATGIAKAPYVAAFVRMLLESDDEARVLLYGWHHAVYALWRDALKDFRPAMFSGEETGSEKEASKRAFLDGDARVLIMSLRAGAGLDGLQSKCRLVVFGELDWSYGVHEQCIGRVHRPGQSDVVRAYFLHSNEGSDPSMVSTLGLKRAQLHGVRDPNAPLLAMQADGDHIKRLAEDCLARAGQRVSAADEAA